MSNQWTNRFAVLKPRVDVSLSLCELPVTPRLDGRVQGNMLRSLGFSPSLPLFYLDLVILVDPNNDGDMEYKERQQRIILSKCVPTSPNCKIRKVGRRNSKNSRQKEKRFI